MRTLVEAPRVFTLRLALLAALAIGGTGLFSGTPLAAQTQPTGTVAGFVRAEDGRPLADATVEVMDAHVTTVSDQRGNFRVPNVKAGTHTVVVGYFGFADDSLSVHVRSGETVEEQVTLTPKAIALAPLLVQGRVQGQARGLMEQRTAPRVENVATSDVIQSRPDANVADAVGRLPGVALERDEGEGKYIQIRGTQPSFSNVTINGAHVPSPEGDTRTVKLDIIPASVVSEVQLNKTLTADMDADAIGGSVNLKTKTPERGEPVASLTLLGGHTDLRSNTAYNGNALVGGRFGPDGKLGLLLTGSWDRNNRPIDDVEPVFDVGDLGSGTVPVVAEIDERLYSYQRVRGGFGGTLDYRLSDRSSLYLHGLFSDFHNYGVRYRNDAVPADGDLTPTSATSGTAAGGTISREVQTRRPAEQIYSIIGGGSHLLNGVALDYSASYSHSQQRVTNGRNTVFAMEDVDYAYDASNPDFPTFSVTNGAPISDPAAFTFDKFDIQNNLSTDHEVAAEANLSVPYTWGTMPATFKLGVKLRDEAKRRIDNDSIFTGYDGSFTLADALSSVNDPSFYYSHYALGPVPGAGEVESFEDRNRGSFVYDSGKSQASTEGADFNGSERVYAVYGMQSVDMGALNVLAGLRIEATRADYTGNVVQLDADKKYLGSTPESGTHSYANFFPSVHLRYAFDAQTALRFAVTQGISRPAFADLAPYLVTSQGLKTLTEGNPRLQPTRAANIDLMLDHYSGSVGVFSVGVYYKKITDFIFTRRRLLDSGPYAGYFASQPQNGDYGHIMGAEVELQHRFTTLPGALGGLGLDANLNLSDSHARVPSGDTDVRLVAMPRQGNANANLELTYDQARVSFRGGLTYNARNIWEYGDDAASDVYLDNHLQFDANATLEVTPDLRLVVQGLNLSNEVFGFYQGSTATPIQREFYGRTLFVGFRYGR
jgi:TonB-dependent receptor